MGHKVNQYKGYLQRRRSSAVRAATALETSLDKAVKAQRDGAWVSPEGERFAAELSGRASKLVKAGVEVVGEFDDEIAKQPDHVAEDDWRAAWDRMHRIQVGGAGLW